MRVLRHFLEAGRLARARYPYLTVTIGPRMLARATEYAAEVHANLPAVPNHSGIEHDDRYRNGFLGELAFVTLLKILGRRYRYAPRTDGQSDAGADVYVWLEGCEVGCNVKVGSRPTHQYLMVPESLWLRGPGADLYIGGRLDLDAGVCQLWGSLWREALAEVASVRRPGDVGDPKVLAPTRLLPLSLLDPLQELVMDLERGEC